MIFHISFSNTVLIFSMELDTHQISMVFLKGHTQDLQPLMDRYMVFFMLDIVSFH